MVETLITSSALIAGICACRLPFSGRISPRIMYAMWGLPALRLDAAVLPRGPVAENAEKLLQRDERGGPPARAGDCGHGNGAVVDNILTGRVRGYVNPSTLPQKLVGVDWQLVFLAVWLTGSAVLLVWILWVNFHFAARLRRTRCAAGAQSTALPICRSNARRICGRRVW